MRGTPENGKHDGCDGDTRTKKSTLHRAIDTVGV